MPYLIIVSMDELLVELIKVVQPDFISTTVVVLSIKNVAFKKQDNCFLRRLTDRGVSVPPNYFGFVLFACQLYDNMLTKFLTKSSVNVV